MRAPWCPGCERFPGLKHPHEWFDRETLQRLESLTEAEATVGTKPLATVRAMPIANRVTVAAAVRHDAA